jgi:hypothetical protein
MKKKQLKLSLYLKFKIVDTNPIFKISPTPNLEIPGENSTIFFFDVDPNKIFNLSIELNEISTGSAVIVEKIMLNDIHLDRLDQFGVYQTALGAKKTYGYMYEKGTYQFKIRYNALSHNYLNFLLGS